MAYRRYDKLLCVKYVARISSFLGSIPERDVQDDKLYNTCTVYNPDGQYCAP